VVAYPADPVTVDVEELPQLTPAFIIVGGRIMHDSDGRLS
jgi:hypothetical protein